MLKIIRHVAEWGIKPETSVDQANHLRLANVFLLFLFLASIVETASLFFTGAVQAAFLNSTAPLVFGGGLLMMRSGYTTSARLLVILISCSFGYILAAMLGPESYFQFIFLLASGFSILLFSVLELPFLILGLVAPLFCFVGLEITHYQAVLGFARIPLNAWQLTFMRSSTIFVIWLLMVGHFIYFVLRRRQSQIQLVSSAKMVAMGRMAAGIAHEVNNPLQRIVGHAERLKYVSLSAPESREQVIALSEQIQSVAMRIGAIVKGLLTLSRDSSGDPLIAVPVRSIVDLSLDYCRARIDSHQVELRVCEIPTDWQVVGREAQLSEVLLNVLNNAYDAVVEAGQRWIKIEAEADQKWIELAITDSGSGVNPAVQHRIFDPFFTTKALGKGTGLGLSVSQGIMNSHGGNIQFDTKSQQTRFIIRIPRHLD
jgi:signal transduction histidine kinase